MKSLEELTPRQDRIEKKSSGLLPKFAGVLLLVIVVVVLFKTLGNASLFFYPVDEAVEKRVELQDRRFRVIGTPQPGIIETTLSGRQVLVFTLCAGNVYADVTHEGDPAELFNPGVPVVLQGVWSETKPLSSEKLLYSANDGWHIKTDSMVVKHDNDYRSDRAELESCSSE